MSNDYYTHGSYPATGASGASASMRAELESVTAGFAKLAALTAHGSEFVTINAGATAQTSLTAAAAKTALGLVIGTNVQAWDADLDAIAGLTSAADRVPYYTGVNTAALAVFTAVGRTLVGAATAAAQRTALGSTTVGDAVFVAASAAAARSTLGSTVTGDALFVAADAASARTTLGFTGAGATVSAANLDAGVITAVKLTSSAMGASETFINGTLLHTRSGNAETIAVKAVSGGDPSAADPVYVVFRGQSATDPYYQIITLTAATSVTISNGSTLGVAGAPLQFRIWIVGFNDAGTFRMGVINCCNIPTLDSANVNWIVSQIYPLGAWGVASSTAEGGAGAADSTQIFYTGTAVSSKPYVTLGYSSWESGLASNGVWASAPTRTQLFGPGVPLPGMVVQVQRGTTGAVATGTTTVPLDDSIPQSGEGDQFMSVGMVPSSACNLIRYLAKANFGSNAATPIAVSLYKDAFANAFATTGTQFAATVGLGNFTLSALALSQQVTTTTVKLRAGCSGAGTTTFNGTASARLYGGVYDSYIEQQEIMG